MSDEMSDSDIENTCELMASDSQKGAYQCVPVHSTHIQAPDGRLLPLPKTNLIGPYTKTKVYIKEQPIPRPDIYMVEVMNRTDSDMGAYEVKLIKKAVFVRALKWALTKGAHIAPKVAGGAASVVFEILTPSDIAQVTFIYGQLADGSKVVYTIIGKNIYGAG
ncbi:MAG TPA: hypothetical protein VJZ26_13190 [Blastocatellia bacterium]|nr:hypothetical protein [Blastocatellia bacterium]